MAELNYKLSQIRVWSFISFKENWLDNNEYYKKKVKQIETKLSNSLHKELTSLFVDESKTVLENQNINGAVSFVQLKNKDVMFGKEKVGNIEGLRFRIDLKFERSSYIFKNKILKNCLKELSKSIINEFIKSEPTKFKYDVSGNIYWKNDLIGTLLKLMIYLNQNLKY